MPRAFRDLDGCRRVVAFGGGARDATGLPRRRGTPPFEMSTVGRPCVQTMVQPPPLFSTLSACRVKNSFSSMTFKSSEAKRR
jgi:hypothetical protein